ncbi:hypothetical protein C4D60_Mb04t21830 [Musa balbisiana]|uniref:Uncharacterized protein n=1 Tax=Musa balbisiana TaxID=52838 RepID=A0A4S8KDS0_MUSBA|nr:hypothetical protein C4D60_Mb04t21830 [Musa balbisiana]
MQATLIARAPTRCLVPGSTRDWVISVGPTARTLKLKRDGETEKSVAALFSSSHCCRCHCLSLSCFHRRRGFLERRERGVLSSASSLESPALATVASKMMYVALRLQKLIGGILDS